MFYFTPTAFKEEKKLHMIQMTNKSLKKCSVSHSYQMQHTSDGTGQLTFISPVFSGWSTLSRLLKRQLVLLL